MAHSDLPQPSNEAAEKLLQEHEQQRTAWAEARRHQTTQGVNATTTTLRAGPLLAKVHLGERNDKCSAAHEFTSRGTRYGRVEVWTKCPTCEEERARHEAAANRMKALDVAAARRAAMLGEADIPLRLRERDFASFIADTAAKQAALAMAREYAEGFDAHVKRGKGLVLAGNKGTGKSHLACAILQALIGRYSVKYTTLLSMVRLVRDTWRRDSEKTESEVMRTLGVEIDLLVVDEVGLQYDSDAERTLVTELLDMRYRELRPTILLANLKPSELSAFIGERVFDRVRETSRWVKFDWESYRGKAGRGE